MLPTWLPADPDKNPMFLEKRVYQGSNGRVYPLPFTDRLTEQPVDHAWQAIWLENEFLEVLLLPEIGGRIHRILDKTNHYDLIYSQPVIKPALVGLAGPWISGGIEFNWPQHHRPATFLPVDQLIEHHADGSVTVWCGDHDPLQRMKGMHGVCLHPGRACVELKVRVFNRTPFVQTFLWWANVAIRVHESYQSFFPPDVHYVADHARRSMSEYPLAKGFYYGVNYAERYRKGIPPQERPHQFIPPHCAPKNAPRPPSASVPGYPANDLSFYANIPVPTSYMCLGSGHDFCGGYDHRAQAGIVHVANHHIAPGKKQWTWGNHDFGYAWDRNLTEPDARGEYPPYIELMAGVYTDNQPDFSFLQPGETKTWNQYWYPIQQIGPAQHANLHAALSLTVRRHDASRPGKPPGRTKGRVRFGVSVTRSLPGAKTILTARDRHLYSRTRDLAPGRPLTAEIELPRGMSETDLRLRVKDRDGCEIISYQPRPTAPAEMPAPATEPPPPPEVGTSDELWLIGLHLEQYRHATCCPTLYWREALRRDPLDTRCNHALGLWHLKRGEFVTAESHFRRALERLTHRNANPYDGEPYHSFGLCLRCLGREDEAYDAFYKATWNQAWTAAGCHALAEIDCGRGNWSGAAEHLDRSLQFNTDNLRARNLKVIVLRKLGHLKQAARVLHATRALDPLDWWGRLLAGEELACDLQTVLDLAHDHARAGLWEEAVALLHSSAARHSLRGRAYRTRRKPDCAETTLPDPSWGALPMVHYTLGWLEQRRGRPQTAQKHFRHAAALTPDYCFPARLEEIEVLETAMRAHPQDAKAPYYLGNLLYDRRRHEEAIRLWERSARLDPTFSIVWRNLGIGWFNVRHNSAKARAAYDRAFRAHPKDARLLYERDQLWKRLGESPGRRLRELEKHPDLVRRRDDLSVELCELYNQHGQPDRALAILRARRFQPWEGGEGAALGQWARSHLALGRQALMSGDAAAARDHFTAALTAPHNLGEARHLLANQSNIYYWLGCALEALADQAQARIAWRKAATLKGDFQEMRVRAFSEMTYYSALAWSKLNQTTRAERILRDLLAHARAWRKRPATIDYFATSLPTMLLFADDLQQRQETAALFLEAQAELGLGRPNRTRALLKAVLSRDPNHPLAADLAAALPTPPRRS